MQNDNINQFTNLSGGEKKTLCPHAKCLTLKGGHSNWFGNSNGWPMATTAGLETQKGGQGN